MRRIEIAKILRNESDFLAKYFLSNPSEISNFNRGWGWLDKSIIMLISAPVGFELGLGAELGKN